MAQVAELNLRDFISKSVIHVFSTMLSFKIDAGEGGVEELQKGDRVVGTVNFVGKLVGLVHIQVSDVFAKVMTASMLGVKPEQVRSSVNVDDAIGELTNMIGGNLKSRLSDFGFACALSIPSITRGKDFQIQTLEGTRDEKFTFKYKEHFIVVEVKIKDGPTT